MSLASSLNTANSIFRNTSQQTSVISTNIANTGNENYVRRDAVVTQSVYGFSSVQNERSQQMALLRQMSSSTAQQSAQSTLLDGLTTLSDALGGNDYELSPSAYLANLQSSLQSFAASPGEYALASTVVTDAIDVVNSLNNATTTTQELREDTDAQMFEQVETLNKLLAEFKIVNDTLGRVIRTGLDVTGNGTLDLASVDRALWLTRNLVLTCNDKRYMADREHVANCFSHYLW